MVDAAGDYAQDQPGPEPVFPAPQEDVQGLELPIVPVDVVEAAGDDGQYDPDGDVDVMVALEGFRWFGHRSDYSLDPGALTRRGPADIMELPMPPNPLPARRVRRNRDSHIH